MDIISVSCAEIQTPVGFLYVILPVLLNQTDNPDCEQSWYSQDDRLIADPSAPQTLIDPVIYVSSDRLVTSRCVNLNHEIICDSADGFRLQTVFRVRNETPVTPDSDDLNEVTPDLQHSDQLWWLFALFIIIIIIIPILICVLLRKRIFRCVLRAEKSVRQIEDSVNRDPESGVLMKLRSDHPRSLNDLNLSSSTAL